LNARKEVKGLRLIKAILKLNINVGSPSQRNNNISENYWMVGFLRKSRKDIRRTSAADTANLGEEFSGWDKDLET